jgi:hypothetical protein
MQWLGVFLSLASLITSGQLVTVRPDVGPAFGVDLASGRKIAHTSPDPLSELSPNGQHLAFVRENNLWISLANGKQPRPLTHNGGVNVLVGLPDVVYGREFNVTRHYWWSPDSLSLAYIETEFMNAICLSSAFASWKWKPAAPGLSPNPTPSGPICCVWPGRPTVAVSSFTA